MKGNSKAMSLVSNLLNQIKTGAPSWQNHRTTFLPGHKEFFVSFCKTAYRNIARPKLIELLNSGLKLGLTAIEDNKIGAFPKPLVI